MAVEASQLRREVCFEEFTALKGLVQKADASELSAQLPRAPLAWEPL